MPRRRLGLALGARIVLLFAFQLPLFGKGRVERWSVKTGTDTDAASVDLTFSTPTTIAALRNVAAPLSWPPRNRRRAQRNYGSGNHCDAEGIRTRKNQDHRWVLNYKNGG